ncbi:RagB/SusD family nutrient uptake outer membrane protein [Flavihumibacter fluvii]|uniref:RagB/SusD family nutrient uptake outer membrane protein n=1 Tax=Flavihumibacter fluvii TaxID=2838157 RepID=UPI001BDF396B|nr:RagB/SusD family nutrient uptake outer membrane protein [Flavihumibacter fluvii]ULQ51961.1 RagB/SusD family nutrient uptake outer membrane protein [Flavihumibacter fluvii]
MKSLNLYIRTSLLALVLFCSCTKDLQKDPLDAISSDSFWKTDADVQMALAGCYATLYPLSPLGWARPYLDALADGGYSQWGSYNWNITTMVIGDLNPTTAGLSPTVMDVYYKGIAAYNYFLENIDNVEAVDPAKKEMYKAEVRFLRALIYFDLVNFYGDVVLYKQSPTTPDEAKVKQSPKAEVLAFVKEDLDYAIGILPSTIFSGHAVKGSAQGLKTRVLLYEEKWAEAAASAKEIMEGGTFALAADYEKIFLASGQTNSPEIMFSTVYLSPNLSQATSHSSNTNRGGDQEFGWGSHLCPYWDLVDAYECTDGKSITQSPLYDAAQPWLNRDPRLKYTIRMPNVTWPAGEPAGAKSLTGINMQKYVDLSRAPFSYSKQDQYDEDYVHIRYADILLMYAEAKNEADGPDGSVYDALDQVRARAGVNMPPVDRAAYSTKETLRDYIRHERRIELALEGQRYFDLKRWHTAHIVLPKLKTPGGVQLVFEEKHYLLPFPQAERDINPNLDQNPGY